MSQLGGSTACQQDEAGLPSSMCMFGASWSWLFGVVAEGSLADCVAHLMWCCGQPVRCGLAPAAADAQVHLPGHRTNLGTEAAAAAGALAATDDACGHECSTE
jgi:hypothetical protein